MYKYRAKGQMCAKKELCVDFQKILLALFAYVQSFLYLCNQNWEYESIASFDGWYHLDGSRCGNRRIAPCGYADIQGLCARVVCR